MEIEVKPIKEEEEEEEESIQNEEVEPILFDDSSLFIDYRQDTENLINIRDFVLLDVGGTS